MLRSPAVRTCLVTALFATTACTQAPAPVEMLGQNNYGRISSGFADGNYAASSYSDMAPAAGISQPTTQSASVSPIGVSDLSAPVQASNSAPQRINPWTHRSRAVGDQSSNTSSRPHTLASNARPAVPRERRVSELDHIVGNDGAGAPAREISAASSSGFMWPVASHRIISNFGPKGGGKVNDGINIASAEGEPVWAAADGEVVYSGNELAGYGNMVLIRHTGGKTTAYAHLGRIAVDKYEHVHQGDIIGYVGATGNVKSPQLHFAIRQGNDPVDPTKFLSTKVAGL